MARLGQYDNLLVMRTASKMGLAGLRQGLLAGPQDWLGEIDKTRLPYNINVLTQAVADLALAHPEVLDEQTRAIRTERTRQLEALRRLPGRTVYPSEANFILVRTPQGRANALFEGLKQAKLDGTYPLLSNCLRVTVGTPEENGAFLSALAALF
jgi:histidinol-phosphate aminotransferase